MTFQFKKFFLVSCLWAAACAQAETSWLNIMGDPSDAAVNTIEVDPTPVRLSKDGRIMRVRVSRSTDRVSWDGIAYRSYYSQVLFNCVDKTARYLSIEFYREPGWKGVAHHTSFYNEPPRWMAFRDVEPNPAQRIGRAACESASVISN